MKLRELLELLRFRAHGRASVLRRDLIRVLRSDVRRRARLRADLTLASIAWHDAGRPPAPNALPPDEAARLFPGLFPEDP